MAKRYWGFNTLAGCRRTVSTIVEDTTAGRFDTSFVASAIKVPTSSDFIQLIGPFMDGSSAITGFISSRFDTYQLNGFTSGNTIWLALNNGINAYRITNVSSGTCQFQYWNTVSAAWVNWGPTFDVAANTLYTFAVNLTINASFKIYLGGVQIASSNTAPTNGQSQITEVRKYGVGGSGGAGWFSQCMAADYDLRDSKLPSKLPSGEGTYGTDGTGAYTDVNELVLDDSTAIQLPTAGQHRTFTKAAIPTVPVGMQISGMVINGRGRIGGAITDGKLLCKQGGTDNLSSALNYGGGYEPRAAFFATDPGTGSAWTKSGFDSAEPGFQAV